MVSNNKHSGPVRKDRSPEMEIRRLTLKIEEYEDQIIEMRARGEKGSAIDRVIRRIRIYTDELNGWKEIL